MFYSGTIQEGIVEKSKISLLIVIFISALLFMDCGELKFESAWLDRDIIIDGSYDEWENLLKFSEDKRITVGMANDNNHLYVCLLSADEHLLLQSLAAGFTVWFDPSGGKKKELGIRFPEKGLMKLIRPRDRSRRPSPSRLIRQIEWDKTSVGLIQNGETNRINYSELNGSDLELRIGEIFGRFIYELKIPLRESGESPFGINVKKDGRLNLGFEAGKQKSPDEHRNRSGGIRGGGGRGGGGRGGKGMGGGRSGGRVARPDMPERLEVWIKVKLADGNPD